MTESRLKDFLLIVALAGLAFLLFGTNDSKPKVKPHDRVDPAPRRIEVNETERP